MNAQKKPVILEIIPQNDTRLQMAQHQIQNSPRAEAILNYDEKLSIVDCNEDFHRVFESSWNCVIPTSKTRTRQHFHKSDVLYGEY